MMGNRIKAQNILPMLGVAALLASVVLPIWLPGVRALYRDYSSVSILFGLAVLAVLTLVIHLSSRRSRLLTACVLVSLFLHMLMVMLFGVVDFSATPLEPEPEDSPRREVAFGMPSLLESAVRETVKDQPVELKTADARNFENRAKPKPPSDIKVTKPQLTPQPAKKTESTESLVQEQAASRPVLRVEDRIQPKAESLADPSVPDIAKVRSIERAAVEETKPVAPRSLALDKTASVREAPESKTAIPKPVAPDSVRDPVRASLEAQRMAQARQRVEESLREAELHAAPDRLEMKATPAESKSKPESRQTQTPDPARRMETAKQADSSEVPVGKRPERAVALTGAVQRDMSLAPSETRVETGRQPQAPGAQLAPADVRRLSEEPIRLGKSVAALDTPQPETQTAAGPTGEIQAPLRARGSPSDAAAGEVTRPLAQTDLAATSGGQGSLVNDSIQPRSSDATGPAVPVNDQVAWNRVLRDRTQPLRGVAGSASVAATGEPAEKTSPSESAAQRTFEMKVERGDLPAPETGSWLGQVKKMFTGTSAGSGGEIRETLVSQEVTGMSGGAGTVVDESRPSIRDSTRVAGQDRQLLAKVAGGRAAPMAGTETGEADSAPAGGAPTGRERLTLERSGVAAAEAAAIGVLPVAPVRQEGGRVATETSLAAPLLVGTGSGRGSAETPMTGAALEVDARGARRVADLSASRIAPGTVRGADPSDGLAASESENPAAPAGSAPERWTVARAQAGESSAPSRWSGSGTRLATDSPQRAEADEKWVAEPEGVSTGRAQLNENESGRSVARTAAPVKADRVALPFSVRAAADTKSGASDSAETPVPAGGLSRGLAVAKATGGSDGGAVAARPSLSGSLPEKEESMARPPSRVMTWLAGMSGSGKVEVPEDLPRGDRMAAYRSVSAAEIMSTPKLQRQKLIYSLRSPEKRQEHILELGGSAETEKAVERALAWLARAQSDDGRWSVAQFKGVEVNGGAGDRTDSDSAVTGLALLAYLGAGYTHTRGDYQATVRKGLAWLVAHQSSIGDLRCGGSLYAQAMASAALCEAYSLSGDSWLLEPARKAIRFICDSQNLGAGWRYEPRADNDTSVTGWMVLALKSGELAGLSVDPQHFRWTERWLEQVRRGKSGGLYAYKEGHGPTPVMTAEGWFCQLFMGEQVRTRGEAESAKYLMENLPVWDPKARGQIHFYYWYYATLALHLSGGEAFETWNRALREALLKGQRQDGRAAGSWDPVDQLGERGGRIYSTTMATLCLEVYYRYLPFYRNAAPPSSASKADTE